MLLILSFTLGPETPGGKTVMELRMSLALADMTLQWRHNELYGVSNHRPRLFTQPFIEEQIKENIKTPRHAALCGEFPGDRLIPCTKGQSRRNVSIWWRHHEEWYISSDFYCISS